MNYIFSPELVAASLVVNSLGTDASVPSSGSHTPKPCFLSVNPMEHSRLSRFGRTCKPLTADRGAALLTSWLEGFRAKTSAWPEKAQDLMVNAVVCGTTWPASLARFDRATHSLKTAQHSLIEDLTGCCVTLPRSGLMLHGQCLERPMLGRRTSESAYGYSRWTTPSASDCNRGGTITDAMTGTSLAQQVNTPTKWPTPTASDHTGPGHAAQGGMNLRTAVALWPTPTVCGNYNRKGLSKSSGDGLATAVVTSLTKSCSVFTDAQIAKVKTYPTATATAYKGWSPNHKRMDSDDRLDYTIERESYVPGQQTPPMRLNPDWVEWLMGWPIGHTALKPLETGRFQEWQQQHSIY